MQKKSKLFSLSKMSQRPGFAAVSLVIKPLTSIHRDQRPKQNSIQMQSFTNKNDIPCYKRHVKVTRKIDFCGAPFSFRSLATLETCDLCMTFLTLLFVVHLQIRLGSLGKTLLSAGALTATATVFAPQLLNQQSARKFSTGRNNNGLITDHGVIIFEIFL